jgi:hypothetical protein
MIEKKSEFPNNDDKSREEYQQILSRRDFVSAAAKLATIGALLNFHLGTAWAGNERQVRAFFDKAIAMGDMRGALDRYANEYDLTKEQIRALSQFDNRELQVLGSLDRLGFSDPERTRLADAARGSSSTMELMKRVERMKFSREQLAGLERWSSGELDAFNNIVTKLARSDSLQIPVTDW